MTTTQASQGNPSNRAGVIPEMTVERTSVTPANVNSDGQPAPSCDGGTNSIVVTGTTETRETMTNSNTAEKISETINAYGDGLTADWDRDGSDYRVTVRHSGKSIATIVVDPDGDIECTASRRQGLVAKLVRKAGFDL